MLFFGFLSRGMVGGIRAARGAQAGLVALSWRTRGVVPWAVVQFIDQGRKMLTLTRKPEETIVIGDGPDRIEVIVKEIRRNQVRIGILAPENVRIFRKELIERDSEENAGETDSEQ